MKGGNYTKKRSLLQVSMKQASLPDEVGFVAQRSYIHF